MKKQAEEYRAKLVEAIVEHDEKLMDKYLAGEEIGQEDLIRVLRVAVIKNAVIPVMVGSALKNKGVQKMLDAVVAYLPSPLDRPPVNAIDPNNEENLITIEPRDDAPFTGLAFKIATDPFVGKLCFVRVYSGVLNAGSYVLNTMTGNRERIGRLVRMHANHREEVEDAFAGEIVAVIGLKNTFTGHTLCDESRPVVLENIVFPEPVISVAIEPKTKQDQEKMGMAMQKL